MTPEERAQEVVVAWNKEYSGWKDYDLDSLLGLDAYEHQTSFIAAAIRAAVVEEREVWHARFVKATTHNERCPFLPLAASTRCLCGAHDELAEAHRELNATRRAST